MVKISSSLQSVDSREQANRIINNLQILSTTYPEIFNRCYNLLEQGENAIFYAINGSDANEKKAGIFLIACLVELNNADENNQMTRFAKKLLKNLTSSDESTIRLASRAIAYLVQMSKTYAPLMEQALNQCCEQLEEKQRNESRLLAAVILARDMALFASAQFFQRVPQFFNNIFKVIQDPKLNLRLAAIQALQAALAVASQRETKFKNEWYRRCFDETCTRNRREENLHAALLIINELLRIANASAEKLRLQALDVPTNARAVSGLNPVEWLMMPSNISPVESRSARALVTEKFYFDEIVKRCMELRIAKSINCQLVLLEIFPRLCHFTETFESVPFLDMLDHAITLSHKYQQYPQALLTIGLLAVTQPEKMQTKITQIFKIIVQIIEQCVSKKKPIDLHVFKCLTLLVRSQQDAMRQKIHEKLSLLFATGLSSGLTEVVRKEMHV